ncbi:MAG TPA: hypothetical protein VKW70_03065 [Terriglobia bacterium]|nr:hypothetical protein [Terriglobia bacterium]
MHSNLSLTDWLNLSILVGIFLTNLVVLNALSRKAASDANVRDICLAHVFWTANWLVWFFAWLVHFKSTNLIVADLLDDIGAFFLIVFAITFAGGFSKLKAYWFVIAGFFIMDVVWLGSASVVTPDSVNLVSASSFKEWVLSLGSASPEDIIFRRTIVFAPSLCLVIVALGLVAWSFVQRFKEWQLSALMALLTGVYAILHVALFQANFFIPALNFHQHVEILFLAWRVVLVLLYSFLILSSAGIEIQSQRIIALLGTVGSVVSTIVALRSFIFGK